MTMQRGRPRRKEQLHERLRQVIALVRQEQSTLDCCTLFDECVGVRRLGAQVLERLPRAVYQRGTTLDLLLQGAALDVMGDLYATERPHEEKLAQFMEAYFCEGRTIMDITTQVLGLLDRSHVSQSYRVEACDRVARRFLTLIERADPLADSAGVREALERQERRWTRAALRLSAAASRLHEHRYGTLLLPDAEQ
ncbi:MAG TPA: hypothetical protein VE338_11485 [Ktedonobacterales bacterium]|jgi:hypothetical protein|nr:hypothetical protein [Ktedonobacterales bacterium]